jgi:flavin-dependent dehydrogenase
MAKIPAEMFDIAIIGAGPAGATLARLVADQYKVLLADKRPLDVAQSHSARKCCGGLLAPDAQAMLSTMGLGLPKSVLVDPQLFVVRAIDTKQNIERFYQRYYINMDRLKFDRWLLSMVPTSVDVRLGCQFKSYEQQNRSFRIKLARAGKTCIERARIIVGADGAWSRVRRQAVPGHPWPKIYFAIQQCVESNGQLPYFSTIFDADITDYYGWTIPKEGHLLIGAALEPRRRTSQKFELLKSKLKSWGFDFGQVVYKEGAYILRPIRTNQISTGTTGIALIGEAAGLISPSSAEGFSYAFRSALILSHVLHETLDGFEKRYHKKMGRFKRNIIIKNLKSHFIYDPPVRKVVMRTGLDSMQVYRS